MAWVEVCITDNGEPIKNEKKKLHWYGDPRDDIYLVKHVDKWYVLCVDKKCNYMLFIDITVPIKVDDIKIDQGPINMVEKLSKIFEEVFKQAFKGNKNV